MKTIDQINQQIESIRATIPGPKTPKQLSKIRSQLALLNTLKQCLANHPDPNTLFRQLEHIDRKITEYKRRHLLLDDMHRDNRKVALKALNKEYEITKLRKQKKALEYLLGEGELVS